MLIKHIYILLFSLSLVCSSPDYKITYSYELSELIEGCTQLFVLQESSQRLTNDLYVKSRYPEFVLDDEAHAMLYQMGFIDHNSIVNHSISRAFVYLIVLQFPALLPKFSHEINVDHYRYLAHYFFGIDNLSHLLIID